MERLLTKPKIFLLFLIALAVLSCQVKKDRDQFEKKLLALDLNRGDIALCGSGQFGKVEFSLSCSEKVRADFNLATALLHSFEYVEAEKVFAKVIDGDPECVMAYWGAAMSNYHPLWYPPGPEELEKGAEIIKIARTLEKSERESEYLEAIAAIFDDWNKLDHATRAGKFEKATESIYKKYPADKEAAIFYALALRATADPTDKSFSKQRKAGEILNSIFPDEPDHPGVAHYIIHTYDYPELAELALPAARKYASIASASAHAQHMPSHIFTRLGLWEESIASNIKATSAAKCYAENLKIKGHWDEELHGMDYLVYAFLQQGREDKAREQLEYLRTIENIFPLSNKGAYSFASIPTRFAVERKQWQEAASLEFISAGFQWDDFPWEKAMVHFGKVLGAVNTRDLRTAKNELEQIRSSYARLKETPEKSYEANQVLIQLKASEAWIQLSEGKKNEAEKLMADAAELEDATDKRPITPGEIIPARELLGDMYMELGEPLKALEAYEADLKRHPNRFNGLYGAALAAKRSGNHDKASEHFRKLTEIAGSEEIKRPELADARIFLERNK